MHPREDWDYIRPFATALAFYINTKVQQSKSLGDTLCMPTSDIGEDTHAAQRSTATIAVPAAVARLVRTNSRAGW